MAIDGNHPKFPERTVRKGLASVDGTGSARCSRSATIPPYILLHSQTSGSPVAPPHTSAPAPWRPGRAGPASLRSVPPPPSQCPETSSGSPSYKPHPHTSRQSSESQEPTWQPPQAHHDAISSALRPSAPPVRGK